MTDTRSGIQGSTGSFGQSLLLFVPLGIDCSFLVTIMVMLVMLLDKEFLATAPT